jgi:uncharacterized protein (TIGR02687 family)
MNDITNALTRLFDKYRIVFWYDRNRELREEYGEVWLPGVTKVEIANNQFGLKYRILREEPDQKFLLYHDGPEPDNIDNWLIDVELAYGVFRADQIALWAAELGLGPEFFDLVAEHAGFMKADGRRAALKELLSKNDTRRDIRIKMLAVCARGTPHIDEIMKQLLDELAVRGDDRLGCIQRGALEPFLWQEVARIYGYESETPQLLDFAIELFRSAYKLSLCEEGRLNNDALVLLKSWKENVKHGAAFAALSAEYAPILNIAGDLEQRDYRALLDLDLFEIADQKILHDLAPAAANRSLSGEEAASVARARRFSHWYSHYEDAYEAILAGAQFLQSLEMLDLSINSAQQGLAQYAAAWQHMDQLYRHFINRNRKAAGQKAVLAPLAEQVENHYNNSFLLLLNNNWQTVVDEMALWEAPSIVRQQEFFDHYVQPFLDNNQKVFVIISDALRYECGAELLDLIRREDRYEAQIEPLLGTLPSFTQLGMAALLPHESLALSGDGKSVLVDGRSATGTANRAKILDDGLRGKATALKAEEVREMSREQSRDLFREHNVVYVYHNRIDAMGDSRETEGQVFEAVDTALEEILLLIKKLAAANVSNMLVTADHGFIYQNQVLDESDWAAEEPAGQEIVNRNRRYVLGHGLRDGSSFKKFTSAEVGLDGDLEILIPKSINRLRIKGAGSRYVHGGAALQEVVIPVVKVNKKRTSDISQVNVEILQGGTSVISTGQLSVTFYQTEPVTAKRQPRLLRAGIYARDDTLISDQHELSFDMTDEEARKREMPVRFVLTRWADDYNNQEVELRLEEQVGSTSFYEIYRAARFMLRRSFTSDFDDFS